MLLIATENAMDGISLKTLHDAIPVRLFERSALKSTLYLLYTLFLVFLVFALTYYSVNNLIPEVLFWPAIITYWIVEGTVAVGLWIIAHECGHSAYSANQTLNDSIGLILHSALLIPYHSWKISHSMHHRGAGHMNKDTAYVPVTRRTYVEDRQLIGSWIKHGLRIVTGNGLSRKDKFDFDHEYLTDIPIMSFLIHCSTLFLMLVLGWPMYLFFNSSGQKYDQWTSHFIPTSPIFGGKHNREVHSSNLGLLTTLSLLSYASYVTSFRTVFIYYIGPYLIVNAWLILITYLHHTDPRVPHYRDGAWTYVKGALATIDRDYGWLINHLHHHIGDTHIVHHLFSRIPHYNAVEATKYIKPLLGENYNFDDTFFLKALWYTITRCHYVPDDGQIVYYKQ